MTEEKVDLCKLAAKDYHKAAMYAEAGRVGIARHHGDLGNEALDRVALIHVTGDGTVNEEGY